MAETGVVKFFNPDKGFGFIKREGQVDAFVHKKDITVETITEGQNVTFSVIPGKDGRPKAINVSIAP